MFTKWKKWTSLALVAALSIGAPSYAHADDLSAISSSSTDADMNASENTEEAIGESPAQKDEPPVSTEVSSDTASAASPTQAEEKETPSDAPVDDAAAFSQSTQSAAKEEETDVSASSDSSDHSSSESVVADSSNSEEGKEKEIEDKKDDVDLSGLDFTSMRLVIGTNDASLIAGDKSIVGSYDNVYLAQYDSEENAEKAYEKYFGKADFVEPDTGLGAAEESAENTSNTMTEALMTENSNPMQELSSVDSDREDSSDVVALVDTGSSSYTFRSVSMIGDDGVDKNGHGTNTAKWITEEAGKASILSIKALNDAGDGTVSSVYAAIQYAISQRVRVINLSLSGYAMNDSAAIDQAIRDAVSAGILVVGAAGNNGKDASYFVPGRCADAIILGSCDKDGKRLPSSNDGATVDYYVASASTSEAAARFTGKLVKASFIAEDAVKAGGVFTKDGESLGNPEEEKGEKEETKDEKTTLSAAADTITITLNANGGTFSDGTTTKQVQCTTWYDRKNFPYPNKSGYISCGWSENASALSDKTNGYNLTNGETLYAVYTPSSGTWNGSTGSWYDPKWSFDVSTGILTVTGGYVYKTIQPWWNFPERITQIKATGTVYLYSDSRSLFRRCENLTSINLANFNTSRVTDMGAMFYGCKNLTSLDLSNFYTSNVTNMSEMFFGCANLNKLDLSKFNTSRVTNMYSMFENCEKLTTLDLSNFNTGNVRDMHRMFNQCHNLTSIKFGSLFKTQNVTTMSSMFRACGKLTSLDVSGFDTRNVTDMSSMFSDVPLTNTSVSNFNTSKVTDMNSMFDGCDFATIDLSHFDTSHVTDMQAMFMNCDKLTSLNLSNFQTSNVKDMSFFVYNCPKLAELNLESFVTSNVTHMEDFFASSGIKKATFGQNFVIPSFYNYNFFPTLYETYSGQLTTNKWGLGSENAATSYSGNDFIKLGQTNGKLTGTWYAQAAKKYTLTYNGNGGTPSTTSTTGYETKTWGAWSSLAYATRTGYYFQGWYTAASGGTQVTSSTPCTTSLTVYAHWKAKSYTISFDANGGSGTTASVSATYDSNMPSITIGLSRSGYTFTGFYDAATGGTKYYNADGSSARTWNKAANTTLYAQWTLTPYKFDVNPMAHVTGFRLKKNKADADNGTTIGDYYADAHMGDKFYLYSPTFATGYEFNGFTNQYGPGTQSISGSTATITMGAGAQAIAINAKATTYSISYNVNGGSLSGQKTSYTIESAAFTLPAPTRTGYTFTGWTGSNGSIPQTTVTIPSGSSDNKSYTANWKANQTAVTLDMQGGKTSNTGSDATVAADKSTEKFTTTYDSGNYYFRSVPSRTGYTFQGYYTQPNGKGIKVYGADAQAVGDGTYYTSAKLWHYTGSSITFYAYWTTNTYTNSIAHWTWGYKNNEGNNGDAKNAFQIGSSDISEPYGAKYTLNDSNGIKIPNGFSLASRFGTYSISNSWALYAFGTEITQKADAMSFEYDYYPNDYSITYELNDGTNNSANPSSYNVLYGVTFANPTRSGYTFTGWTMDGKTVTGINPGANASFTSADDLYSKLASRTTGNKKVIANWKANSYTVAFNGNGATYGSTASESMTYDTAKTLTPNGYSRAGYRFAGWNTKADGSGTSFTNESSVKNLATNGTVTLYAKWQAENNTITYSAQTGGNVSRSSETISGTSAAQGSTATAKTGYTFDGWYAADQKVGASASYIPDSPYSANKNSLVGNYYGGAVTYDASNDIYNVTASKNSANSNWGSGASGNTSAVIPYGKSFTVSFDIYSPIATAVQIDINNYAQTGSSWNGNDNDGSRWGGTSTSLKANTWTRITYSWTNDSAGNTNKVAMIDRSGIGLIMTGATSDITFKIRNYEAVVSTGLLHDASSFTARFTANKYNIAFQANGGSGTMANETMIYDTAKTLTANSFVRTGYTFVGWNTKADGSGTSYTNGATVKNLATGGTVTLYAKWTPNIGVLTYNANGGMIGTTSKTGWSISKDGTILLDGKINHSLNGQVDDGIIVYGSKYDLINTDNQSWLNLSRTGYHIKPGAQWNTRADGTGTSFEQDTEYTAQQFIPALETTNNATATVYAKWVPNAYDIVFDANTGTGTMSNESMTYDTAKTLTANSFVRTGYTFAGWNTKADGSGTKYADKESVKNLAESGTVILYAQWTANTYTVTIPTAISYTNMPTGKVDVNTSFDISVECKTGSFTDTIEVSSAATQMASKGGGNSLTAASKSSQTPLSFTSAGTKQDQVAITGIANTADVWTGAVQYTVTKK